VQDDLVNRTEDNAVNGCKFKAFRASLARMYHA
jgi:hypothetical protein